MKTLPTLLASLVLCSLPSLAQEANSQEAEDLDLFQEAVKLLEEAKLSDVLDERKVLQELDLEAIPDTDAILDEARNRLKDLQEQGVIAPELVETIEASSSKSRESTTGGASDVLGPGPQKAPRVTPEAPSDMITIENSRKFAGSLDEGILVFEGDVLVTSDDEFTLRCDKLVVHLNEKRDKIELAIATGRMVIIDGSSEEGPVEARCQEAVYRENILHLRLWPEVSMPGRLWKAQNREASLKLVVDEDGNIDPKADGGFAMSFKKPEESVAP